MTPERNRNEAPDELDELIARCRQGRESAFRALYDRYAKAMYNTCFRILNNHADSQDAMQEGFCKAFKQLATFDQRSTFGYWLKRIMVNTSITLLRKRKHALAFDEIEEEVGYESEETPDCRLDVHRVHQCIQQLAPGYRTVLSLYLIEGYDHKEIAKILNVAESTTRTQYLRARKKLQANLNSIAV